MRKIFALFISILITINFVWAAAASGAVDYSVIRVLLSSMGAPDEVLIEVKGEYFIPENDTILLDRGKYVIALENDHLILQGEDSSYSLGKRFTFKHKSNREEGYLRVLNNSYGWTDYTGDMEVRLVDDGINLINHVYLETYLYGVVPFEMPDSWPLEALKAQAVAARTYAVRCRRATSYYDLFDTEYSQVYRGYVPNKKNSIRAVDETKGQVLKYGTSFAGTYYSSSNGGKIESTANLWGGDLPYSVVKDDPYDARNPNNPHARWTVEYSKIGVDPALASRLKVKLKDILGKNGYSQNDEDIQIKQIKELSFDPPDSSGRVHKGRIVLIIDAKKESSDEVQTIEQTLNLTKSNIRSILNLKSLLFTVEDAGDKYIIKGAGYGHGVGMSQYGAQQMAKEGFNYIEILEFYYPGTQIETLNIVSPDQRDTASSRGGERSEQSQESSEPDQPSDPGGQNDSNESQESTDDREQNDSGASEEAQQPEETRPIYGRVNVSTALNVRQGPGLQYKRIGKLGPNTRVQILDMGQQPWYRIKVGELVGFVHGNYIELEEDPIGNSQQPGSEQNNSLPPVDAAPPPAIDERYGIVTASALNVRSGPSTRNHRVGMVIRGTKLTILEEAGGWYRIKYGELEGYVYGRYLYIIEEENNTVRDEGSSSGVVIARGTVTASVLNFRSGPGTEFEKIGSFKKGTVVDILEEDGAWYKIRYGDRIGFVYSAYLEVNRTGTVTASWLNVRTGPAISYRRIDCLPKNTEVIILSEENGWYKIRCGSTTGYVSGKYIKIS